MNIGVIGVNFRSADLSFRERLAQKLTKLAQLDAMHPIAKVFLSTCNRFEVYFNAEQLTDAHSFLLESIQNEFCKECRYKLYSYFDRDCFIHLCRVTSGLDSAIIAETEIQGQVKRAYLQSSSSLNSKELHFLFQKSLKIGKSIRSQISIKLGMPTLTSTLNDMLVGLQSLYKKPKLLFVGTSSINLKLIEWMKLEEFDGYICSRSPKRAQEFASQYALQAFDWKNLDRWSEFDGVIVATSSSQILIDSTPIKLKNKKLILDLGVPRNAAQKIGEYEGVQLFNIDQLNKMVRKYRKVKSNELLKADLQIQKAVFTQWSIFQYKRQFSPNKHVV